MKKMKPETVVKAEQVTPTALVKQEEDECTVRQQLILPNLTNTHALAELPLFFRQLSVCFRLVSRSVLL